MIDEKILAVIDTNVLVSALFSINGTSNPAKVIRAVLQGNIMPLYCDEIIEEYRDVLSRGKFHFNPASIEALLSAFINFGHRTYRFPIDADDFIDQDDVVFYQVSLSVQSSYLVTGNIRHFPNKPFIVTPSQMVDILQSKEKGQ